MNILVISQYYYPEPFKINEICEELVKHGNSVTVLTGLPNYPDGYIYPKYKKKQNRCEKIKGVDVYRTPILPRGKKIATLILNYLSFPIMAKYSLWKLSKEFDCVFCYQLSPVFMLYPANYAKKKYNCPLVTYCLDLWPASLDVYHINEDSIIFKTIQIISNKLYAQSDSICVTSPSFLKYLSTENKISDNKLKYLPQHGEQHFLQIDSKQTTNKKFTFMFAGNIGIAQGFDCLVSAILLLNKKTREKLKFVIIGTGSYLEDFKNLVQKQSLEKNFEFLGKRQPNEMVEFYKKADALFLTLASGSSISTTIPAKLQGYMAAGKPILACIDGDAQLLIEDVKCGLCGPAGDSQKLSENILNFLSSDTRYLELGINGRNYYKNHFTLDKFIQALETEFQEVIKHV